LNNNITRIVGVLAAPALVAAACGSTVKTGAGGRSPGSSGLALPSVSANGGGAQATNQSGATGGATGGYNGGALSATGGASYGGATDTGSPNGGGTATPNGVTSKLVPASAPGVTNTTIYIGASYSSQSAQGDKAIGAAGAAPSYDGRNVLDTIINYANAHGGFAGRKLQALYYDYNLTTDSNTQDQSACAHWTQDNKVFAIDGGDDILNACASKAGALILGDGSATQATYRQYPNLVDPDGTALDRMGNVEVNGLFKAGYFTGKLGLVTWDDPEYRATIQNGYLPALSAHHITPDQIVYISVPQAIGAVSDMTAAVSSAVTKFKSLGIDHVMIQDGPAGVWGGDGLTLEWMDQAKSQDYYPRYGANPLNNPGASINPSDEMNKELAVDDADYDASYDQGWHPNQARALCYKIEADAGYPVKSSNPNDEAAAAGSCDGIFFLQAVLNRVPQVSISDFVQQTQQLGTSFASSLIYGTKFLPGRRDGGDEFRTEEYFSSCSCLQYQSSPYYPD
jgi:hypothetical protein